MPYSSLWTDSTHTNPDVKFDVAVIGGGIAGMSTAARLQAAGLRTIVCEAHSKIGGCAGYYRRRGFAFDVGATTLVDFEAGGVGDELLRAIGLNDLDRSSHLLPGYVAWLPDRKVTLYRDADLWQRERLSAFGDTLAHRRFWKLLDQLSTVFWNASRSGIKLPLQSPRDILHNIRRLGLNNLPLMRYLHWTMGDALHAFGLRHDKALTGLLAMLVEDTVHSAVSTAPLINAALGVTIRGAGLSRHAGGMRGFWERFGACYRTSGGVVRLKQRVIQVVGRQGEFAIRAVRSDGTMDEIHAHQVVSAIPAPLIQQIAPEILGNRLQKKLTRDSNQLGGAVVVFLGVPDHEVSAQTFTHHQLLQCYDAPLGNGNNMFISVSEPGDTLSAPPGYRTVMISTHCALAEWERLTDRVYESRKCEIGQALVAYARRVYPCLGEQARVYDIGTPRTYQTFALRPRGAVGGVRQTCWNSNQFAIPNDIGVPGFWLVGDTTFPGLGTVACVLGSRIVAEGVLRHA